MLASLTICNVVLIDQLSIEFDRGLCALTGETGAGKSILLDSLGLALGARSDAGLVRKGAEAASVTAEFDVPARHDAFSFLKEQGVEVEGPLILRRQVSADGRSRAFINDQPVSISLLKDLGERLVEIHGQFETQSLLNPREHRGMLDAYGVAASDLKTLAGAWSLWNAKTREAAQARERMDKARAEEDYLRGALEDLDELSPKEGEEEKLTMLRARLMKREQIFENLETAQSGMEQAEGILNSVWRALEKTGEGAEMMAGLDRAGAELKEVMAGVQALSADLEELEFSLEEIDDRLHALKGQARKHGCPVDALAAKREEIAAALNMIERQDDVLSGLMKEVEKARAAYADIAAHVSDARRKAALKLDKLVTKELVPLKLEKAKFETKVEDLPEAEWGAGGSTRVTFLVATNPGSAAGPLSKIASGGEMARFMLALKVILAEVGSAGTLVFDEVDSGIGGATASSVGERLARLAAKRQILVVTHSPQVAAKASHHWIVAKEGKSAVKTNVVRLPGAKQRQEEIARMLAGEIITDEARAAAGKLMEASAA